MAEGKDVHRKMTRSYNMSRIKSKNTKPENLVRKFLYGLGIRYRIHSAKLPGKPDIVIPKLMVIIDVRGCYWHRHDNCKYATFPSVNKEFYKKKFEDNVARDVKKYEKMEKSRMENNCHLGM